MAGRLLGMASTVATSAYIDRTLMIAVISFGLAVPAVLLLLHFVGSETLSDRAYKDLRLLFGGRDRDHDP